LTPNGKVDRRALPNPQGRPEELGEYVPPRTELERIIADLWAQLLRVDRVGMNDSFFALGGHSLLALNMLYRLNQGFSCDLRIADVYSGPTVKGIAERIRGESKDDDVVSADSDGQLDPEIVPSTVPRSVPSKSILLTGGAGFVGRFLLAQLLQDTEATIYCLLRASSAREAMLRIKEVLSVWNLWRLEFERRIVAIPGDLRLPAFGIDHETYVHLSEEIDEIYHCATSMNHLETYAMAKASNVESTRELLRLATCNKQKLINYISTLGVFSSRTTVDSREVYETTDIRGERHGASRGYVASKWMAENIFKRATERGVPCNVFRLGLVWADRLHGRYDDLQREYRILKSCLVSGYGIEGYKYDMAPTPVDYVARAVVFLGTRHVDGGKVFHITSTGQAIGDVFERCNEIAGASLEIIKPYEWMSEIKRLHHGGKSMPIVPLVEITFSLDRKSFDEHQRRENSWNVRVNCDLTHSELEQAGIVAPTLDDSLLKRCLDCMYSRDRDVREAIDERRRRVGRRSANESPIDI
ncbi:thioester reductase domain-containing protein, partial [Steroidobacter flavus]